MFFRSTNWMRSQHHNGMLSTAKEGPFSLLQTMVNIEGAKHRSMLSAIDLVFAKLRRFTFYFLPFSCIVGMIETFTQYCMQTMTEIYEASLVTPPSNKFQSKGMR